MIISKVYILESQMHVLSTSMTGKRQITIDSVWIDKVSAKKFVKNMQSLQVFSSNPTTYKLIELKPIKIKDIYISACNDRVFLSIAFKHDSVSQYGDVLKDDYYSMQVAIGHQDPSQYSINKQYLYLTGSEILGFNFTRWNKEELHEGKTIRENFSSLYKAWSEQGHNL